MQTLFENFFLFRRWISLKVGYIVAIQRISHCKEIGAHNDFASSFFPLSKFGNVKRLEFATVSTGRLSL
jgi:hypothetical protein